MDPFAKFAIGIMVASGASFFTAAARDQEQLARSAGAVLLNWLVGSAFAWATGITDAWWWSIVIDIAAATVILLHPAGRCQAAIGATYVAQIGMHFGYGWCWWRGCADAWAYYDWLTTVAWVQLGLLGGWCGSIWLRPAGGWRARLAMAWRSRADHLEPPR